MARFSGGGGEVIKKASTQRRAETIPIRRRNERDRAKAVFGLQAQCPLFLSDFNET
jgi:hypothetical protein